MSRLTASADPVFVRSLKVDRGQAIDLAGQRWSQVAPRLQREVLDTEVEVSFKKQAHNDRSSSDTFVCRLVTVWNEEARKYHVYPINIAPRAVERGGGSDPVFSEVGYWTDVQRNEVELRARQVPNDQGRGGGGADLVGVADAGGEPSVAQPGARPAVPGASPSVYPPIR